MLGADALLAPHATSLRRLRHTRPTARGAAARAATARA
jgi:hypothetical protein